MQRVLPPARSMALFNTQSTRAIEQRATAALPAHALMRRAGWAVARLALAIAPHAPRVWVCAGPGNNGGDGLDAAIHLAAAGKRVSVTLLGDPARLPDDARDALSRAQAAGVAIASATVAEPLADLDDACLVIDALLGLGASRAPDGPVATCIDRINSLACPV